MSRMSSSFGSVVVATVAAMVLAAALATLINVITADAPPISGMSCKRECRPGENLICTFEFDVHRYQTYSRSCSECFGERCQDRSCIRGDGTTRFITVVNRMLPGPSIEVCEGDTIKVTVRNLLPAEGVSVHWHGILHKGEDGHPGTPYMDGVPGVTQCPIQPGTSFTYTLKANPAGTHFWYAQTGFQRGDGVFGSLVVRRSKSLEVHSDLYDEDSSSHSIVVNDWTHILTEEKFCLRQLSTFSDLPQSLLVNGIGPHEGETIAAVPKPVPHKRFTVIRGQRHRFRITNAAFLNCPFVFSVENHKMTLIELDGSPLSSAVVDSALIYPGERLDVVIGATKPPGPHWMVFKGRGDCLRASVFQLAILDYAEKNEKEDLSGRFVPYRRPQLSSRDFVPSPLHENLKSLFPMQAEMRTGKIDQVFFLFFNRRRIRDIGNHPFFSTRSDEEGVPIPQINNFTFGKPSSPLLQKRHPPGVCLDTEVCEAMFCECLHLKKVPIGALVDLVLVNEDGQLTDNVVHFHGYRFYVIGSGYLDEDFRKSISNPSWRALYSNQSLIQNLENPILKDTVPLPAMSYVVLRFLADNPGFWSLESQLLFNSEAGMKIVFMVGNEDEIPQLPSNFPHCGNYP